MKKLRLGFTGTKDGMDITQKADLVTLFQRLVKEYDEIEFHHGDCIGADAQAARLMDLVRRNLIREFGPNPSCQVTIIAHPGYIVGKPDDTRYRAFSDTNIFTIVREPKPFIARDRDIVDETDELVATPLTREEQVQSGTWTTVRYARKKKKPVTIINPVGSTFDPHALPPQRTNAVSGETPLYGPTHRTRGIR